MLMSTGYVGYRMVTFTRASSRFEFDPARDAVVEGTHFVSTQEVVAVLGTPSDAGAGRRFSAAAEGVPISIFGISLDDKRKQVETLPWVSSATVARVFPKQLVVHVTERTPIAFANMAGHIQLVDADGVFLERPEKASFDFPILTGLDSNSGVVSQAERRARLVLYQQFTSQLASVLPKSGWVVSEADLSEPDDLKTLLVQGRDTILVHFGRANFTERFHRFLSLLPEMRKMNSKIDSVDLRYRNQVVMNPATLMGDPGLRPSPVKQ